MAMALRPIDNALPVTPERPKKQAKVAAPIQKRNDENQAPLPPSADATIDYVSSENLKPLTDPDSNVLVILHFFLRFFLVCRSDLHFFVSYCCVRISLKG